MLVIALLVTEEEHRRQGAGGTFGTMRTGEAEGDQSQLLPPGIRGREAPALSLWILGREHSGLRAREVRAQRS